MTMIPEPSRMARATRALAHLPVSANRTHACKLCSIAEPLHFVPRRLATHQPRQLADAAGGAGLPAGPGGRLQCPRAAAAGAPVCGARHQRRRHSQARLCGCCSCQGPQTCSGICANRSRSTGGCRRPRYCGHPAGGQRPVGFGWYPEDDHMLVLSPCPARAFYDRRLFALQELQRVVDELLGHEVPSDQPLMEAGLDSIGESSCNFTGTTDIKLA
jgi:hypothetical protein